MDFFESLHKYVSDNTDIHTRFYGRVYPMMLPQKPILPAIVYTPIMVYYDRALLKHTGFVRQKVQFTVYDKSFGGARISSRILKKVLQDFRGAMDTYEIQATHILTDLPGGLGTQNTFNTEEYSWILELEFNYMDKED